MIFEEQEDNPQGWLPPSHMFLWQWGN